MSVIVTGFGPPAFEALRATLAELRAGDPLAPVEVAVPSSFVGLTVRRRLADPGLIGVRFAPLPRLITDRAASVLAAAGALPVTSAQRRTVTRAVLAGAGGDLAASARRSPSTADVVTGVFAELDDLAAGPDTLEVLDTAGRWPGELAGLYRRYVDLLGDAARPDQVVDAALDNRDATPLVVYLPRRLTATETRFCRGLSVRGLLRVVVALTGEDDADRDARVVLAALRPDEAAPAAPSVGRRAETRALPDAEEEARYAVRRTLGYLAQPGGRVDRVGIGYRAAAPYARLVTEQLCAAGLPHHAPRQRSLAQTVPGRTLLGLLRLPDMQWSRVAVFDWLRDTPVRDGRHPLPVASWQRRAGEAGVTRGPVTLWTTRLERLASRMERAPTDEDDATWRRDRAASVRALAAFVTDAAARVAQVRSAASWADAARLVRAALDHYLGGTDAAAGWGGSARSMDDPEVRARCAVETAAYEETVAVIDGLAALDAVEVPYDVAALLDVLAQELSPQVHEATGLGRGVLVGPVSALAGADLDLLVVVGAAEGRYPPRGHEHPLLRDQVRRRIGLRTLADQRGADRRDHLALLASAPDVVLTHPVADTRAQRGAEPSAWLLEQTDPRLTSAGQKQTAPPSFQASVCDAGLPAVSVSEYDVRLVMSAAPLAADHPLAAAVPELARGVAAARDRVGGVFGAWTGGLSHPVPGQVTARLDRTLSATSLQSYATCPFHYYLDKVLGVRPLEQSDADTFDARERGTAVHDVLEQLVRGAIERDKPPTEPWTAAEHADAQRMLGEQADRLLAEGKAGRPTVWAVRVERWRRQLRQVLFADDEYRLRTGSRPLAVEHGFGGEDPLVVELPGGAVRLQGSIDRVDRREDGALVIFDYKTGGSKYYDAFAAHGATADLTDRGEHLQLPLYALAARRDFGEPATPVAGYYWFVDEGDIRLGGSVDDTAVERLHDVLDTIASGIRDGAFPVRPGEPNGYFRTFENCRFCDFTRVCSVGRDDLWDRLAADPRVSPYAKLAEPAEDQDQP